MQSPSLEKLLEGARKSLQNLSDLIHDAEVLYENERWARCVFLSSIAIEEAGKHVMIISAIVEVARGNVDWEGFWRRFKDHEEKTGNILVFNELLGPFLSSDDPIARLRKTVAEARQVNYEKQDSLYVHFAQGGFMLPGEVVCQVDAQKLLDGARAVHSFFENMKDSMFRGLNMTADEIKLAVAKGDARFRALGLA